jgi:hypothetical protein
VSGYLKQPAKFDDLLQILELELRIITRTDAAEQADSETPETFYLLTHDFLVPSIRSWVEAELEKSRSGRALSRLRVREKIYSERRESRQLPSLSEWLHDSFLHRQQSLDQESADHDANRRLETSADRNCKPEYRSADRDRCILQSHNGKAP